MILPRVLLFSLILACVTSVAGCQSTNEGVQSDSSAFANSTLRDHNGKIPLGRSEGIANPFRETPAFGGRTAIHQGNGRLIGTGSRSLNQNGTPEEGDITLNLVGVPVAQAAKVILGDTLGIAYTVDTKIDGKITVQTPRPLDKASVVDLFQSALRANNAVIIETAGAYRITSADQAYNQSGAPRVGNVAGAGARLGTNIQIVPLKYVSASEVRRILEPISPRGGVVRADDARGTITLSGTSQELSTMIETIGIFDVDVMKGMSFAIVPVKSSSPDALVDDLKVVFGSEKDGPMNGMIQLIPNKRLGSILIVSQQPRYIARAEAWIRKLDNRAQGSEKQFYVYNVRNRSAKELVDVVQAMFTNEIGGANSRNKNIAPRYQSASSRPSSAARNNDGNSSPFGGLTAAAAFGQSNGQQGNNPSPISSQRNGNGTPDVENARGRDDGDQRDEPRVKLVADDANNSIMIMATSQEHRRILRLLETLDIVPNQVLIEATIAEVSLTDELKFGMRWYFQGKRSSYSLSDSASGALGAVFPGFSYAMKAAGAQVTLNALNEITDVNVISSPSLMVVDNKTAVLQIGDQVPISTQSAVSVGGIGAPLVNSISYKDTGVILSITPRINESGRVLLEIEQEVSSVAPTTTSNIDSPTIRQRRVKTTVLVNDNEALALGGLIQDKTTVTKDQVPILGDIPLIGNAFKSKTNTLGKTELVILITPRVVRDLNEAQMVTDEYRRKLASYMPRAKVRPKTFEQTIRRTFE